MRIIDYSTIDKNIKRLKKNNDMCLVLKNDAYGFGIDKVFKIAFKNKIYKYAVNTIDEAIYLRKKSKRIEILLFGYSIKYIRLIKKYNIIPTASTFEEIKEYKDNKINFAVEFDIGMNRFGFKEKNHKILNNKYLKILYIHFPYISNNVNLIITKMNDITDKYKKRVYYGGSIITNYTNRTIRVGKIIYDNCDSFYGNVLFVKSVNKGEKVGYDGAYLASCNQRLAILDVGYYNGINVNYTGYVFCKNKRYEVVGKTCMNNIFVLVDDNINIGDVMEFYGQNISKKEFLDNNKMTEYESFLFIK